MGETSGPAGYGDRRPSPPEQSSPDESTRSWTDPVFPPVVSTKPDPRFDRYHVSAAPAEAARRSTRLPAARETVTDLVRTRSGAPLPSALAERICTAVAKATAVGEDCTELRDAIGVSVHEATGVSAAFDRVAQDPAEGLADLRRELQGCVTGGRALITSELEQLERRVEPRTGETLGVSTDERGRFHLDWGGAEPAEETDTGRLVLVGVGCAQAGEGNEQVNVFVHVVDDPSIDFRTRLGSPDIRELLGELSASPEDPERRKAVHRALVHSSSGSAEDWTTSFESGGSAGFGRCAHQLNGTVAVFNSRCVQIGDQNHQENRIVHTVSPTIEGATLLADNPALVNAFMDMACSPGDRGAADLFADALDSTLTTSLARSRAATASGGRIYRPPAAGRTLTIRDATGVTVGRRVSQKDHHLHEATLGRRFGQGVRAITSDVQRAGRARG